jgi:hypothetical protein
VVQAVENLTRLSGRVVARAPHPRRNGWDAVVVHVDDAGPVPGKADLLSRHRGADLPVALGRELLAGAGPGDRLTFRARFGPDGATAEPHPDEGDLRVEPVTAG